jgi:uncharacterized repeat protein (TIGR03803 family)
MKFLTRSWIPHFSLAMALLLASMSSFVRAASVAVPNVVGLTEAAATTAIDGAGLIVGTVSEDWSSTVPAGILISQSPAAGTEVAPGSAVNLTESKSGLVTLTSLKAKNGEEPFMESLVQGEDGNLYGTTNIGGANGDGIVFKVTPSGTVTVLYSFAGTDGSSPYPGLLLGTDGNFYGTTYQAGTNGYGTVFQITPGGTLTTLHNFSNTDGAYPIGVLIQGTDGYFYGTTAYGGNTSCTYGCGTIFRFIPDGTLTTLNTLVFFDGTNGYGPEGGLVQGTDGNFYGTTGQGGSGVGTPLGTVFQLTSGGTLNSLHTFDSTDGREPVDQLVETPAGLFLGTTVLGGAHGAGEVFQINTAGKLTVVHSFDVTDGYEPETGLLLATDGHYYGTAYAGGKAAAEAGTVFRMTAAGKLSTLHSFNGTTGSYPYGGLVQYTSGVFYGVTSAGGTSKACLGGCGTIFGLNRGLAPFVKLLPAAGSVGTSITILGNELSSASAVSFNGKAAAFTPGSDFYLTAVVPSGATTGSVEVTTSGGTLKSSTKFSVIP